MSKSYQLNQHSFTMHPTAISLLMAFATLVDQLDHSEVILILDCLEAKGEKANTAATPKNMLPIL